jgi:predicted metal-dependent TIM-barrel fold hydrolase
MVLKMSVILIGPEEKIATETGFRIIAKYSLSSGIAISMDSSMFVIAHSILTVMATVFKMTAMSISQEEMTVTLTAKMTTAS